MIKWAGLIIGFLGAVHLVWGFLLTAGRHAGSWFSGELWLPEAGIAEMDSTAGAFWMTTGSFGLPLIVVGMTVLWMDRRGIVPPAFIAWTLGGWSLVGAVILEPSPWILTWIPVGMLLTGIRRADRAAKPVASGA